MVAQRKAIEKSVQDSPINDLQKQLQDLQTEGQRLQLENDIKFDPMTRQIQKLADAQKELSYNEIVQGIKNEQAAIAKLQPQIDSATAAVDKQKAAVDAATAARDAISKRYDVESAKLQSLNDQYSQTEGAIRDIQSALNDLGGAASDNIQKAESAARAAKDAAKGSEFGTPGAQNFMAAAGAADFADPGGTSKIGREGGVADQAAEIDKWTKGITDDVEKAFGQFDMFKPIKDWWNKAWGWVEKNVLDKVQPVLDGVRGAVSGIKLPNPFSNTTFSKSAHAAFDTVVDIAKSAVDGLKRIWELFAPDIKKIWNEIIKAGKKIWNDIGPELEKFKEPLGELGDAFKGLWSAIKPIVVMIGVTLLAALKLAASIIANTIGPVFDFIIDTIKNVIKVLRGFIEIVIGIFSGDWKMVWQGVKDIVSGVFGEIWAIIKGAGKILWGIVKGIVEGIVGFFKWLYDILVGHSIIPDMIKDIIKWIASLPGKAWDALKDLGTKIKKRATEAWDDFSSASKDKWNRIIAWVKALPGNAYDNFKAIRDKLKSLGTDAWQWLWSAAKDKWNSIVGWVKGLPTNAYNNIKAIKDKLAQVGRDAFNALKTEASKIVDGKNGFITWVKGIPGKIARALGGVGGAVANAVKNSWNGAADWLNRNAIGNVNKVTSKFGFSLGNLPRFAGGGVIPGRVSREDNVLIAARTGEGVIVPELVRALGGARGLARANAAAKRGNSDALKEMGVSGYRDGGVIGSIKNKAGDIFGSVKNKIDGWMQKGTGFALDSILSPVPNALRKVIPGRPFFEDFIVGDINEWRNAARHWGDKQDEGGGKKLPGIGYQYQLEVLRKQFPDIVITSTTRPGAQTVSGNTSYHALGRAVDMAPDMKYFDWILANYGKTSKELIYSPAGRRQIKNGMPYMYTGAVRDMHFNHVHWAYDQGGLLQPGNTLAYNGTRKEELVLTNGDMTAISNVMGLVTRMVSKSGSGATPGAAAVTRMSRSVASLEASLRQRERMSSEVVRGNGGDSTTLHFHGDLSFPNVQNGDDADDFIKHLKSLAG